MPQAPDSSGSDAKEGNQGQVVAFPRSPEAEERPSYNLPLELSSFVGREREIAEVKRLLDGKRLLTLTGPGGCGKTRLALAVAFEVVEGFEGGVWLVELASLSDPDLVAQAVASTLGVREAQDRPLTETLSKHLVSRKMLLVLDNCEHLVEGCAALADALLRACPDLKILATSREALGIAGERAWVVPSLSVPNHRKEGLPSVEDLARYEAIRLFCERAEATSGFELTEQNASAVARLCRKLDGIPLAIELAAARTKVLSVEQISARLEYSLKLLAGTARTAPARQRTLRGTLDWSYQLLNEQERKLFGRLSVFAGGWTLEAAETVGAGDGIEEGEVLDLLGGLVDKSMVVAEAEVAEGVRRYRMLEPVRQYGIERLEEGGEKEQVRDRHARYYLALAEEAEPGLMGPEHAAWLERLAREHANFRAALSWTLAPEDTEPEDAKPEERAELGLRLAATLGRGGFWVAFGLVEGLEWLERGLAKSSGTAQVSLRTKALNAAGWIALWGGDYEKTVALTEEGLALSRELEDKPGIAYSLFLLAETAALYSDHARMKALREEAKALRPELEDRPAIAYLLICLGLAAQDEGDHERVETLLGESMTLHRELGDKRGATMCLSIMGISALERGDPERAALHEEELLRMLRETKEKVGIVYGLMVMAGVAVLRGKPPARAARLWGAEEALREAIAFPTLPYDRAHYDYEGYQAAMRSRLDDEAAFEAAWAEGRAMTPEQAVEYALGQTPLASPTEQPTRPPVTGAAPAKAKTPPELLCIFALGPARVERGGHTLAPSEWAYAKPRELLFYLLSHPSRTREQIGLALWPDASASQLRSSFHHALHHLRRVLGGSEWIVFKNGRYAFDRSLSYFFDVEAFESYLAEAKKVKEGEAPGRAIPYLKEAAQLYRGDFLEEDFLDSKWAMDRQEDLRHKYSEALLDLGGLLFEEGRYAEGAEAYRKVIAQDSYFEEAHRELMRCYARQGEGSRAIRHYQGLVELLGEELGSSPAPKTNALYERLCRGEEV